MRFQPTYPSLAPEDPQKLEIWTFVHQHPRVTHADIAAATSAGRTKQTNYMRALRRHGVLREAGREGTTHFYTVLDDKALSEALAAEQPGPAARLSVEEEQVLNAAREFIKFSADDLEARFPDSGIGLAETLQSLLGRGMLRETGRKGGKVTYSAHSQKQAHKMARERRKSAPGAMWTAIRIQKRFAAKDIYAALAASRPDLSVADVQAYCTTLTRAGYLRAVRKARRDIPARYLLVRDTGPLPPVEQRLPVVIDTNEDRAVYVQGGRL